MFIRSPKELALRVITERKKCHLSQAEVGKLVGLKQQTISDFENRPESTKLDTLFRILSAVKLDVNILTKNGEGKEKNKWKEEW
jgi:HTH-type transcriptional regulator/antitoxin HipB